jgi:hypothetical protein
LGKIAAGVLRLRRGRSAFGDVKQPGTFSRLYDRQKFGMVEVRTASLSQLSEQTRHRDCNENAVLLARENAGETVRRNAERFAWL